MALYLMYSNQINIRVMKKVKNNRMKHLYEIEKISAEMLVQYIIDGGYDNLQAMPLNSLVRDLAKAHRYFSKYRNEYIFAPIVAKYEMIKENVRLDEDK